MSLESFTIQEPGRQISNLYKLQKRVGLRTYSLGAGGDWMHQSCRQDEADTNKTPGLDRSRSNVNAHDEDNDGRVFGVRTLQQPHLHHPLQHRQRLAAALWRGEPQTSRDDCRDCQLCRSLQQLGQLRHLRRLESSISEDFLPHDCRRHGQLAACGTLFFRVVARCHFSDF